MNVEITLKALCGKKNVLRRLETLLKMNYKSHFQHWKVPNEKQEQSTHAATQSDSNDQEKIEEEGECWEKNHSRCVINI